MKKVTKKDLLARIEALENENKQRGIGNQFMTLKCIQGNRTFTKDVTYAASKTFDSIVITNNFGSVRILEENKNMFGGYKVTHDTQTAVFQVIGTDVEIEPKLKQLDQSVFDGLDEKWRFAAVCGSGKAIAAKDRPETLTFGYFVEDGYLLIGTGYDTTNWKNSLIERDIAKELLEVDLSSELTGSELCKAMLARGDKFVMCFVHEFGDDRAVEDEASVAINFVNEYGFQTDSNQYNNAVPINNQGEPLTASEVGL